MIVYHATNKIFNRFKNEFMHSNETCQQLGHGFYFSDDIEGTRHYGDIILKCQIPDYSYYQKFDDNEAPRELIEYMIRNSPKLRESLGNMYDLSFYGFEVAINKAIALYTGYTPFQLCNVLSNDFYDDIPIEFNWRFEQQTNYVGVQDCHNFCIFDSSNIKILKRVE